VPRRVLHDQYFKQAKAEGYVARSAYKLLEIQDRRKILRRGARVLDVGCAPGSWLQVASRIVGPKGSLVGIDLKRVDASILGLEAPARIIEGDVTKVPVDELLAGDGPFDAVISDMAPNTTGAGDDLVSARLCRVVLDVLPSTLKKGGALVMKVLEGAEYPALLQETRDLFTDVKGLKPKASRDVSREMFIIATGFKGVGE